MNKRFIFIILFILLGLGLFLFRTRDEGIDSNKLQIAASFYPLYYFTSEIGGDLVQVYNITPSGVEPHDYEPTPRDIVRLQQSRMVVINGAGFEPWIDSIQDELENNNVRIVTASSEISLIEGEDLHHEDEDDDDHRDGEEVLDPHVWLSPRLAQAQVDNILAGLIAIDPDNRTFYEENADRLKEKLKELDQKYQDGLTACRQDSFVTAHAAFGYLATEYNLNQVPIAGMSPEQEPSPSQLAEVVRFVRENNVEYIFFEELVSLRLSETIARETGAKTLVLNPVEGLTDEQMTQGENYFTIMEANLENLRVALSCT